MSPSATEVLGAIVIIGIIVGGFVVWAWIDKRGPHIFTRETPLPAGDAGAGAGNAGAAAALRPHLADPRSSLLIGMAGLT